MKKHIITLLAVLLLLSGCSPVNPQNDQSEKQKEQEQENNIEQQNAQVSWNYDLGTIPENITNAHGLYAMANGFIYCLEKNYADYILEYDIETGKTVALSLPERERLPGETFQNSFSFFGNVFMLPNGIGFIEKSTIRQSYLDEDGKKQWTSRPSSTLSILSLDGKRIMPISELGTYVFQVVPIKKAVDEDAEQKKSTYADNPLAGLELYYYFGYDTFPEMAEQMAQDGFTLEEPTDPNKRNQYIVPSLGYMDGDTRETKVLLKGAESMFVDKQYIYTTRTGSQGETLLYRSSRDQIDFQHIELGEIGNEILPADDGFYFFRTGSWQVCRYQDGEITELPIASAAFMRWGDQLIYNDMYWEDQSAYGNIKGYDLNTGEIRDICESAETRFHILNDQYLACKQITDSGTALLLIDLETGEQIEMHREEDEPDTRPAEVQQAIEKAKAEREKEQQAQQESTGE